MRTVNIHEAKTHLSRLLDQISKGESFVIAKAGKPVARVVPLNAPNSEPVQRLGFMVGQMKVPEDFDSMGREQIEKLFTDVL